MTPPLCESDFNTGADLSPQEPQSGLPSETGPLISDQTQTTVLVSNNPSLKASADPDGRVGGTGGTFKKKKEIDMGSMRIHEQAASAWLTTLIM